MQHARLSCTPAAAGLSSFLFMRYVTFLREYWCPQNSKGTCVSAPPEIGEAASFVTQEACNGTKVARHPPSKGLAGEPKRLMKTCVHETNKNRFVACRGKTWKTLRPRKAAEKPAALSFVAQDNLAYQYQLDVST